MRQRCRRCVGKRTLWAYGLKGVRQRVVCAVCKGTGKEWRKNYPPQPSRHFLADTQRIIKETAAMLKEAADNEWYYQAKASCASATEDQEGQGTEAGDMG